MKSRMDVSLSDVVGMEQLTGVPWRQKGSASNFDVGGSGDRGRRHPLGRPEVIEVGSHRMLGSQATPLLPHTAELTKTADGVVWMSKAPLCWPVTKLSVSRVWVNIADAAELRRSAEP